MGRRRRTTGWTAALAALSIATTFAVAPASAQDLRFEFKIDAQIGGTRPWDGSMMSSSALDELTDPLFEDSGAIGQVFGAVAGAALDTTVDEMQATHAPPDPYICIAHDEVAWSADNLRPVTAESLSLACTPRAGIQANRVFFNLDLPPEYARLAIFGVVLVDSDAGQPGDNGPQSGPSGSDEVIGFGLYISPELRDRLRAGDTTIKSWVESYETALPVVVERELGLSRVSSLLSANPSQSTSLELEKITLNSCSTSCRFGDATLTIKDTVGGW